MTSPTYTDENLTREKLADIREHWDLNGEMNGNDFLAVLDFARAALAVRPSTGSDAGDLVKRLERHAAYFEDEMHALDATVATRIIHKSVRDDIREAAASIAALSEKLRDTEAALAITEAAMDNLEAKWRAGFDEAVAANAALSEENDRLKAALEMIAAIDPQVYFKNHNPSGAPGFIGPHATIAAETLAKLGQMKGEG